MYLLGQWHNFIFDYIMPVSVTLQITWNRLFRPCKQKLIQWYLSVIMISSDLFVMYLCFVGWKKINMEDREFLISFYHMIRPFINFPMRDTLHNTFYTSFSLFANYIIRRSILTLHSTTLQGYFRMELSQNTYFFHEILIFFGIVMW